jgi:hypothetical protein
MNDPVEGVANGIRRESEVVGVRLRGRMVGDESMNA